ncbi:flagellar export protein FliJ [Caproicibacter sp. BJN0012]|uniref:flagellar export protein FliJ n=1 Tax=Caproicibacter sp. BJN0012 TaxID=3110227 RepID=UPI002E11E2B7
MPRGRKKATSETLEQQINNLDVEIESYQQKIREAKDQKKELVEQKKKQDLEILYSTVKNSGKSMEEVLQLIKDLQKPVEPEAN